MKNINLFYVAQTFCIHNNNYGCCCVTGTGNFCTLPSSEFDVYIFGSNPNYFLNMEYTSNVQAGMSLTPVNENLWTRTWKIILCDGATQ
jgi:hypothetical protein